MITHPTHATGANVAKSYTLSETSHFADIYIFNHPSPTTTLGYIQLQYISQTPSKIEIKSILHLPDHRKAHFLARWLP